MASFELVNLLAVLTAGRNPQWNPQAVGGVFTHTGVPASIAAGVSLNVAASTGTVLNAIVSILQIEMRENVAFRTARVSFNPFAVSGTWVVSIDGNAVSFAAGGGDDADAVIDGLIAALSGVGAADALVTFEGENNSGATPTSIAPFDTLLIKGKASPKYSVAASETATAGALALVADAETADRLIWTLPSTAAKAAGNSLVPLTWAEFAAIASITPGGSVETLQTNGRVRGYVELASIVGDGADAADGALGVVYTPRVYWGPCVDEPG